MKQTNRQRAFLLATKLCTGRGRPPEIPEWIDWAAKKILRAMNASRRAARKKRS